MAKRTTSWRPRALAWTRRPPRKSQEAEPAVPLARHKAVKLLLVEDHVDTRKVLGRLLRQTGHEVRTADTVASGRGPHQHQQVADAGELPGRLAALVRGDVTPTVPNFPLSPRRLKQALNE